METGPLTGVHSFSKCALSTFKVWGSVISPEDTVVNKRGDPGLMELVLSWGIHGPEQAVLRVAGHHSSSWIAI